jgi:hypothetical protein
MKNLIFSILCIGLIGSSYAQVPGYMGKKFLASYNLNLGFGDPLFASAWGIYPRHCLSADYVISRQTMIGLSYDYLSAKVKGDNSNGDDGSGVWENLTHFSNHNIGINFTVFPRRNGTVAPLGRYIKFKAYYGVYHVSRDIYVDYEDLLNNEYRKLYNNTAVYKSWGFGLGYGSIRMIGKKVTLDLGGEVNVALKQFNGVEDQFYPNTKSDLSYSESAGNWNAKLNSFLWGNFLGSFKIGVGGLLF